MLTRNYYNQLYSHLCSQIITGGLKDCNGNTYNTYVYGSGRFSDNSWVNFLSRCSSVNGSYGTLTFVVGSGNTPATLDDYKLESIISAVGSVTPSDAVDEAGNYMKLFTVKNIGTEPFTVAECGITAPAYRNQYGEIANVLVDRTVLEKPITVPAGGVCIITYKVEKPGA